MSGPVTYERDGAIGVVTLSAPPANSYHTEVVTALGEALDAAAADAEARVVILRSGLEKFFCAGADVKAFVASSPEENVALVRQAHGVLDGIAAMPKVVIAEIGGHALGGGLEIALACDLRVAAEGSYRLGLPEVTLGLLPGTGGTQRLPRMVGPGRALELMLTGRTVPPEEALDLGIVERLVPPAALRSETSALAGSLAGGAPRAIAAIKDAVHRGLRVPLPEGLALEQELLAPLFASGDGQEGMAAFFEKRPAAFRGE